MHGSAEATEHLKQHCLKHVCPHVYAPQIDETIDVTSDLCAYKVLLEGIVVLVVFIVNLGFILICSDIQVQLSEKLMSNVLFKKVSNSIS